MSESLDALRGLTPKLTPFPDPLVGINGSDKQHYKMIHGDSWGIPLLQEDGISCAKWFFSGGCEFPVHGHTQREWIIIYAGKIIITLINRDKEGRNVTLRAGDSLEIPPETEHSAIALEDTYGLAITIPKAEEWPND